jgi:hypothetical protein
MKPFFRDVTIDREFETGTHSETYQVGPAGEIIPALVGNASASRALSDRLVHWDGRTFVMESGSSIVNSVSGDVLRQNHEVWSAEPDGRIKLTITTRTSTEPPTTAIFMYRSQ